MQACCRRQAGEGSGNGRVRRLSRSLRNRCAEPRTRGDGKPWPDRYGSAITFRSDWKPRRRTPSPDSHRPTRLSPPRPAARSRRRGPGRRRARAGARRRQHPPPPASAQAHRRGACALTTPSPAPPWEKRRPPPASMRGACPQFRCVHLKMSPWPSDFRSPLRRRIPATGAAGSRPSPRPPLAAAAAAVAGGGTPPLPACLPACLFSHQITRLPVVSGVDLLELLLDDGGHGGGGRSASLSGGRQTPDPSPAAHRTGAASAHIRSQRVPRPPVPGACAGLAPPTEGARDHALGEEGSTWGDVTGRRGRGRGGGGGGEGEPLSGSPAAAPRRLKPVGRRRRAVRCQPFAVPASLDGTRRRQGSPSERALLAGSPVPPPPPPVSPRPA